MLSWLTIELLKRLQDVVARLQRHAIKAGFDKTS